MVRILNAEPDHYHPAAREILSSLGETVERRLTQKELPEWVRAFDVLIIRLGLAVTRDVLEAGQRLRVIVTATTGLDHIDMACAHAKGVTVLSLNGEREFLRTVSATAEHVWALLLALARHIPEAVHSVRSGSWDRDAFRGRELSGRRLGIVGLGRIGEQVARYGLAFGMRVAAFSLSGNDWQPGVERCATLEELLSRSDVLTLHVPLNAQTQHLIGERELALLPKGAIMVNTARGGIVDEGALIDALTRGHLAGAALDVINGEQDESRRKQSLLIAYARQHDHLIITPHIGGATEESMARTEVFMAQKLKRWYQTTHVSAS